MRTGRVQHASLSALRLAAAHNHESMGQGHQPLLPSQSQWLSADLVSGSAWGSGSNWHLDWQPEPQITARFRLQGKLPAFRLQGQLQASKPWNLFAAYCHGPWNSTAKLHWLCGSSATQAYTISMYMNTEVWVMCMYGSSTNVVWVRLGRAEQTWSGARGPSDTLQ